jgi:hypothetical protein
MKSLTKEERRVVAHRLFEALCVHYPNRYIALIERPERAKLTIVGGTTIQRTTAIAVSAPPTGDQLRPLPVSSLRTDRGHKS